MNILDQLADHARERVRREQAETSLEALREQCLRRPGGGKARFTAALEKPGVSLICEIKRASPSRGMIAAEFPYLDIAREYTAAGADCISCLTEPKWFLGSDKIFTDIRQTVDTPMIRKDFTVDAYQIYQAKAMGADAVLLICALLDTETIARYLELCDRLELAALVETHNEEEIASARAAGARIIGVNNRNLKNFSVDFSHAARLRELVPPECLYVAESGVKSPEDVAALAKLGADAVLMGEVLMTAPDRPALLRQMRRCAQ